MKLGLGLSLPGVAAMGGKASERILATAKHLYDARRGSAWTDYGSGGANGTPTNVTHATKWWSFNGASSYVDLFPNTSVPLGVSDEATFVYVARRAGANPIANEVVFAYKDSTSAASRGMRTFINTSGASAATFGDGSNSSTKNLGAAAAVTGNALCVWVVRMKGSYFGATLNGSAGSTDTSRGSVGDGSPATAPVARAGAQSSSLANYLNGEIGLIAAYTRWLTDEEAAVVSSGLASAFA